MSKFIIKIVLFSSFLIVSFLWVLSKADGFTDPFYLRFTSPRQSSLILGTSRAAQDINPKILNQLLFKDIYNYAFTVAHSPYGPTYLKSIKKKIDTNTTDGVFIVTIDPWSISSWTPKPNDSLSFRELERCLGNTNFVNMNPNFFYLIHNWQEKYINILTEKDSISFLHSDGWLEITIDMDSLKVNNRLEIKEKEYREDYFIQAKFSKLRLQYLIKTIRFLYDYGDVYLVRLPIHPKIMEVENDFMPDFNIKIKDAVSMSSGYLDLSSMNNEFIYTDGNHLYKDSGIRVSELIGQWILNQKQK